MLKPNFSLQQLREFDNHLAVIAFDDSASGLKGYIGIHNTNRGPALGGTRFQRYSSHEAALRDVLNLSRAMSYKCGMAGLSFGGGKGVIMNTSGLDKRAAFQRYALIVHELRGLFKTGTDVGIYDDDVQYMAKFTSNMLGVSPGERGKMSTSNVAALGVYYGIKASLRYKYGSDSLDKVTIGVKGVGKLGGELVRLLHEDGAALIVADIDSAKCQKLQNEFERVTIAKSTEIHTLPMEVFSPCALGGEITSKKVKELKTSIVAGGANNQLAGDNVGELLHDYGVLYAPDYIVNAGGLIYVADELEPGGFNSKRVLDRTEAIGDTVWQVFRKAEDHNCATSVMATRIAEQRISSRVS